ncbi:BTAD domain-containing putative transcriptional regulator [Streptomyces sp. NPDC053367]|uniref:AfsR/SARP family transcriptional regulator n=1 Tax=Streptomyces sp. NPDC053367 TaxID=3365700 RepID=UPI0037CE0251
MKQPIPGALRFEVLGPLRVHTGDRELGLGFPQRRALLALLLLHSGRPVPTHHVIDVLWPAQAPVSARNAVRRYAGELRRLLEPGLPPRAPGRRLLPRNGGYLLEADRDEVDLLRFRDLARRGARAAATGRSEEAVRGFTAALAQWRGPVAMGIPEGVRAHVEFTALEGEFVRTVRMAADAALRCGRAEDVLPALRRATALEPLDEPLHARLVHALTACGRRAEALTAYETIRLALARDLSVPPGPELAAAHAAVLHETTHPAAPRHSAAPGHPAAPRRRAAPGHPAVRPDTPGRHRALPTAQLPSPRTAFVGRAPELAALAALTEATAAPVTVLLTGMPGVGKSTLAAHWADTASARFPGGLLHADLGASTGRVPAAPADVLAGLLASLGMPPDRVPEGAEARTGLYRTLVEGLRVLVVLDDAADSEQVRPLLPPAPGSVALVTSRRALPGLVASGARPLRLEPPDAEDALALLAERLGPARTAAEPRAAEEIVARCGRLPLALTALAASGRPDAPLEALAAALRADPLAGTGAVREALLAACRGLTPEAAGLLRLLPRHPGAGIAAHEAAALAGLPQRRARRALGELADTHLLTERTPGRYTLHELVRAFAAGAE